MRAQLDHKRMKVLPFDRNCRFTRIVIIIIKIVIIRIIIIIKKFLNVEKQGRRQIQICFSVTTKQLINQITISLNIVISKLMVKVV